MPSYLREPSVSVCWNCDRQTHQAVAVTLCAPSAEHVALTLCPDCHASSYLPLAGGAPDRLAEGADRPTVLVVDDDPDILWVLGRAFEDGGYAVETAGNGLEALHRACRRMPNLVVLDLRMPVMDGRRFIEAWSEVTAQVPVPIVAISAQSRQPTAEELGVDAFLLKPFDLDALVGTVDRLLKATA